VGPQVTKAEYDRLGRQVRRFILGTNNDSTYADADDVSGDVVAEESHTTYDATTGLPIIQANIRRHPNASTSSYGALYNTTPGTSYSYSNITGRISISANYYDELDRQTDTASYGTAGITVSAGSWSYAGSVPSRSATILITSNTYGADGSVVDVTDPMGRITRTEYDNHGHRTKVTKNYVDGTAGGGTNNDEDQITNYTYSNGLMDSMTVDVATKSSQTTTYGYGVARGSGGNLVSSNRLMFKEEFPGSVSGSDKTVFAYNAQGQRIKRTDAGGNIIDTSYDVLGRETSRVASTVGSGFDTGTRAIATAYLARGMRDTITSYSNTGMSTETNQVQYSYDGWGNMVTFNQDVDGAIGAGGVAARSVSYTYDNVAPTGGILGLQRASMTMPNGTVLDYKYTLGEAMGRVDGLTYDGITLVEYSYLGAGTVAETTLGEPGALTSIFASGSTTYPYIDNFGRVTEDYWLRIGGRKYTDGLLDYDRNGNIQAWTDELTKVQISGGTHDDHLFDSVYTNDGLNRLVKADEGKMTGSVGSRSIASAKHTRIEEFTLEQTGNWANQKLDLNGDGDQSDGGEKNWNNSHDIVNAITAWGAYSPGYDAVGNMTDDGRSYKYVYDGFNRLVKVTTRGGSPATVAEYKYNSLGYRIAWHYDADLSSAVDGSDPWYYFIYDDRWRIMATYRGTDSTPKEQFVYHVAGAAGYGGSSYIDSVILRDSDDPEGWTNAADGVLETRHYILQNWRADVVALIDPSGDPFEYIRYSPYGVPFVYGAGDVDRNGQVDAFDPQTLSDFNSYGTGGLVVDHDINRDGVVDSADDTLVNDQSNWAIWSQGRGIARPVGPPQGLRWLRVGPRNLPQPRPPQGLPRRDGQVDAEGSGGVCGWGGVV
jgi:YD repeat-containing protein